MKNANELIAIQRKSNRRKKIIQGIRRVVDIISSIAVTLLAIRDKPKVLDYFSVGMAMTNVG